MRLGVDVGGTKVEVAAIADDGTIRLRRRVATPDSYPAAVAAIAALVLAAEKELGGLRLPVGFAIPGAISPATGLVKNAPNSPFNGHPLDQDLAARLARPVRMMNDANCFALSEARDGAAAGASPVFGVILGTGCGGGLVVGGDAVIGANAIAGEWGHNPLPWADADEDPALPCACGKAGCIETYLSGTGLRRHHAYRTGQDLPAPEIAARGAGGDAAAADSLRRHANRLARALAAVINTVDPEAIVLGGGLSSLAGLYESVPAQWGDWVFSDAVRTRLLPPRYGDSSGVRGAAWLWPAGTRI